MTTNDPVRLIRAELRICEAIAELDTLISPDDELRIRLFDIRKDLRDYYTLITPRASLDDGASAAAPESAGQR